MEMAMELLTRMRPHVEGTYIMPSFGRYELGAELVSPAARQRGNVRRGEAARTTA